ncbi:winged helix-turn-helix transcriptional regulator [Candidatus Saccharibacteria bacterium]|nr:winged helix-turn-helix transcriptional regulator [Candidatus Saccharibacteria bacterium]
MHDNQVNVLKALADKTRLDIVRCLAEKPNDTASCHDVSSCSTLSQPAMSHHFKILVTAGVVLDRKIGTEKIYELNNPLLVSYGIDATKL